MEDPGLAAHLQFARDERDRAARASVPSEAAVRLGFTECREEAVGVLDELRLATVAGADVGAQLAALARALTAALAGEPDTAPHFTAPLAATPELRKFAASLTQAAETAAALEGALARACAAAVRLREKTNTTAESAGVLVKHQAATAAVLRRLAAAADAAAAQN